MADDDVLEGEEQESAGNGKKKLIAMAAGACVLLLGIGAGVYFFLFASSTEPEFAEDGTEVISEESGGLFSSGPGKAQYHKLEPKFTTTFEANGRQRYMQVEITLVTREQDVLAALSTHQPLIRNAMVMLLGSQDYLAMQTMEGKAELRTAAIKTVQDILRQEIGKPGIEKVLFTDFVMQ